jgi:hypothetical protein
MAQTSVVEVESVCGNNWLVAVSEGGGLMRGVHVITGGVAGLQGVEMLLQGSGSNFNMAGWLVGLENQM